MENETRVYQVSDSGPFMALLFIKPQYKCILTNELGLSNSVDCWQEHQAPVITNMESRYYENGRDEIQESTSLIRSESQQQHNTKPVCRKEFWVGSSLPQ